MKYNRSNAMKKTLIKNINKKIIQTLNKIPTVNINIEHKLVSRKANK